MLAKQTVIHQPACPPFRPYPQPITQQGKVATRDYGLLGGWLDSEIHSVTLPVALMRCKAM